MSLTSEPNTVSMQMSRMKAPARYMSWLMSDCSSSGPAVGRLSTMATMMEPDTSLGSSQAMVEMKGLSARRSGYLTSKVNSDSPLARAVVTYGLCNSSSMLARITRIRLAVPDTASITTGIQRCPSRSTTLSRLQGAVRYCSEKSPPTLWPK